MPKTIELKNIIEKGSDKMGQVLVTVKIENFLDWAKTQAPGKKRQRVRSVIIPDAIVDTGATYICLPKRYIKELGLLPYPKPVLSETANGVVERKMYHGAHVTIEGRSDEFSVLELPDSLPALIGVIPLEALDFIVDPIEQRLTGKHGKKRVLMLF